MRLKNFTLVLALQWAALFSMSLYGQSTTYQIITANGGKYEFTPPFSDYVTLQSTSPQNFQTTLHGTIYSQSVQDVICSNATYFVAAGDSVVKFDGNTYQRLAATRVVGANKLAIWDNYLLVSRQFPATDSFLFILSANDLSVTKIITQISGESAGILCTNNRAFVAVNYGWAGTLGKIAAIDLSNLEFISEIDLGTEGTGIYNIYLKDGLLLTVNKTPWGGSSGFVSSFNLLTGIVKHYPIEHVVGSGYGIFKDQLFLNLDGNIGTLDVNNFSIANSSLIANPYASIFGSITSAVIDTLNSLIYLNAGDYFSFGQGYVYSTLGDSIGIFSSGISAEAIAVDYRSATGVNPSHQKSISVYPNPFTHWLQIVAPEEIKKVEIFSLTGEKIFSNHLPQSSPFTSNLSFLPQGMYLLRVECVDSEIFTQKILKR